MAADRASEADERREPRSLGPGQPGVEVRRGKRGVVGLVEQPEFLLSRNARNIGSFAWATSPSSAS